MKEKFVPRLLDLGKLLKNKSYFLFGPRQTGKTSLIDHSLQNVKTYNLLDTRVFLALGTTPTRIREELKPSDSIIVIDEIQKLPNLLNEVQLIIDKSDVHFLLTGSSARKLRRGGVNLLGGRARKRIFHPFVLKELKEKFDLIKAINQGLIPSIYFSDAPDEDLQSYVGEYLKEEISAEAIVRNVPAFSRFLEVAALSNGQLINYSKIASDAQVPTATVRDYFQILKDTLIAFELEPYAKTSKRKPLATSKFYFFDMGVVRVLQQRRPISNQKTREFGEFFEHYIFHELKSLTDYQALRTLNYWRSKSQFEVDFIFNDALAIEVKSTSHVSARDLRGLKALREEKLLKDYMVVSFEDRERTVDGIHIFPWKDFINKLWQGDFSA